MSEFKFTENALDDNSAGLAFISTTSSPSAPSAGPDGVDFSAIELKRAIYQAVEILSKRSPLDHPIYSSILIEIHNGIFKRSISLKSGEVNNIKINPKLKTTPSNFSDILENSDTIHEISNGASSIALAAWLIVEKGVTRRQNIWEWKGVISSAQLLDAEDYEKMILVIKSLVDKFEPLWCLVEREISTGL